MTTLLPNAKQQFLSAAGVPLAGGSVYFYVPGTTTFKNTWQDGSQIALNTNPVILDSAGEAVIFGLGSYRQIVFDALGNQIWDQVTSSTDAGGIYSGGTSTGTAANQIVATTTPAGFSLTSGNQLTFIAGFTSTGATTLNANGTGAKNILKPGGSGPVALTAGDIVVGDAVVVYYDGTQYQIINPVALPLTGGSLSGAVNEAKATIASATSTAIGAAAGNYLAITGTTTITSFDTIQAGTRRILEFAGALTLTHNATTLILSGGVNITTYAGLVLTFVSEGSGNWRQVTSNRAAGGTAQIVNTQTGAVSSGTTAIPHDDTIPQNTEGDQYMSLAITPTNASSTLLIDVVAVLQNSCAAGGTVIDIIGALFQDSTVGALAAVIMTPANTFPGMLVLRHKMTAGTTSATTFKFRAGSPSAANAITFNGTGTARLLGGVMASSITITEILP